VLGEYPKMSSRTASHSGVPSAAAAYSTHSACRRSTPLETFVRMPYERRVIGWNVLVELFGSLVAAHADNARKKADAQLTLPIEAD
jgi:hypothetical protein